VDPALLYPSRRGNLIQLLLFAAMGGLLVWIMLDFWGQVEAARQPVAVQSVAPDPTPGILFEEQLARQSRNPADSPRDLFAFLLMPGVLLPVCLWLIAVRASRLLGTKPLIELADRRLTLRDPLGWGSKEIPLGAIRTISLDRADRQIAVQQGAGWWMGGWFASRGARLGARLRHTLRITYREPVGEARTIEISDLDVQGGTAQLRGFADYLGALTALPVNAAT
jgi:hypothetical protein